MYNNVHAKGTEAAALRLFSFSSRGMLGLCSNKVWEEFRLLGGELVIRDFL